MAAIRVEIISIGDSYPTGSVHRIALDCWRMTFYIFGDFPLLRLNGGAFNQMGLLPTLSGGVPQAAPGPTFVLGGCIVNEQPVNLNDYLELNTTGGAVFGFIVKEWYDATMPAPGT